MTAASLQAFLLALPASRASLLYSTVVSAPFHITVRRRGESVFSGWFQNAPLFKVIEETIAQIPAADLVELWTAGETRPVDPKKWEKALVNRKSGRAGAQVTLNGSIARISPLETIATNRPLKDWFLGFLKSRGMSPPAFFSCGGRLDLLPGNQFLIESSPKVSVVETFRGNSVIDAAAPAQHLARDIIGGCAKWLMANLSPDGALPYKYWPSKGEYSEADNPIRRFMATIALNRLGHFLKSREIKAAARQNLEYNLSRFFRGEGELGLIDWDGSVKLGAVALAGLAIFESPNAERWSRELEGLRRTIDRLWREDGSFRTFLYPAERNDNHNFYPGEALLFWSALLQQKMDADLLGRASKSIAYYRDHFHRRPNPAFVPWHTQAAVTIFELTGRSDLRDYIFEMNDWLLPHQQWGGKLDADLWGRFYSPAKPDYGPPHASSTGVYMEGLVDALIVARATNDEARAAQYELSLHRAIRSIAQLQFKDRTDAFYVYHRKRVLGAIRTEVYNNEIRIDNVQHPLMALLKFSDLDKRVQAMRDALGRNVERNPAMEAVSS